MTTKTKAPRAAAPRSAASPLAGFRQPTPSTTEGRLECIAAMGQRIDGYIQFICKVGALTGSSAEEKEKAVAAFYERMVVLERHLGCIQEELRLG